MAADPTALFNEMVANITAITDYPQPGLHPTISDTRTLLAICQAIVDQAGLPTGTMVPFAGTTAPTGYIFADGFSIGNASSNATERANADTLALFTLLWNGYANTVLAIRDSTGTPTTRGVDAATDFAANKQMSIPDLRGRVAAGKDDMGGSSASRLTAGATIDGKILGNAGGSEKYTLLASEMPPHRHRILGGSGGGGATTPGNAVSNGISGASGSTGLNYWDVATTGGNIYIENTGGGLGHLNIQPTYITNYIIKL